MERSQRPTERSPASSPASPRNRNASRVSSVTVTRTPMLDSDPELSAMMTSVFDAMHYANVHPTRVSPGRSPQAGSPGQPAVYGPAYNPNWSTGSEYRRFEQGTRGSPVMESTKMPNASFALQPEDLDVDEPDEEVSSAKAESLIEWFDRSVEKELAKRREPELAASCRVRQALQSPEPRHQLRASQAALDQLAEATAAGHIEVPVQLGMEPDTELGEAVDRLAKAEAMCAFAAAVQAAEQAADAAPPELAEEAAAMGAALGYRTDTHEVRQVVPGERPVEVVGYIGITKPKNPKRS